MIYHDDTTGFAATHLTASIGQGRPFTSVATVEGVVSREFDIPRIISPGAVRLDQVPFPLLNGHDPEQVIGRVDRMYRLSEATPEVQERARLESPDILSIAPDSVWVAEGFFATNETGNEIADLVEGGFMRGVSVGAGQAAADIQGLDSDGLVEDPDSLRMAFSDFQVIELSVTSLQAIGPSVVWLSDSQPRRLQPVEAALVASGALQRENNFHLFPEDKWFTREGLPETIPAHMSITDEGHIYGWLGKHGTAHGASTRTKKIFMPREDDGHPSFHAKAVKTMGAKIVACGVITAVTNHAGLLLDARETVDHYDHTGFAVADVVVLQFGSEGYVVSGGMRTTVSEEDVRAIRGANLSGDWRTDASGKRRLRAILAVNCAGFDPADGAIQSDYALVASFAGEPVDDLALQILATEIDILL